MKKYLKLLVLLLAPIILLLGLGVFSNNPIFAGDDACNVGWHCDSTRIVNQWSCEVCNNWSSRCEFGGRDCSGLEPDCLPYEGDCLPICNDPSYIGECNVTRGSVDCNTSPGNCQWTGNIQNCEWSGGDCSEPASPRTLSCCALGGNTPTPNPSEPPPDPPSCSVSLDPAIVSVSQGTDINYIASVSNIQNGTVSQVNFSSDNTSIATVDPSSDASSPYMTTADTLSLGTAIITANVVMDGATRCSDTSTLEVATQGPWWQVIDSDLISNGDIITNIPASCALPGCNPLLGLEGLGGFPGVPVFGTDLETGSGDISVTNWSANTETIFNKVYDYDFFSRLVRPDVTLTEIDEPSVNGGFFTSGGAPSRGYVWYHFDGDSLGDLVINSSVNMPGDRKVVVLVENADLYIDDRVNVVDGAGYMMFIVGKDNTGNKGNIYVDAGVSHPSAVELEGVFFAEGQFRTGAGTNQLHVRGMVAALDGVVLERDLEGDNADEPAEVFEYAPDFVLTFPRDLTFKRLRWKEVAP